MATLLDSTEVTECDIMVDRVQANVVKVADEEKGDQEQKKKKIRSRSRNSKRNTIQSRSRSMSITWYCERRFPSLAISAWVSLPSTS